MFEIHKKITMTLKSIIGLRKNSNLDDYIRDNNPSYIPKYSELVSIFYEQSSNIVDITQKENYVIDANKILSSISRVGIPQSIMTDLPHPEMIPYIKKQEIGSSCGTSCIRTILLINYGIMFSEKDMWKIMKENNGGDIKNGTSPIQMVEILNHVHSQEKLNYKGNEISEIKFFMSRKGGIEQLKYLTANSLLPIINRPCYETNVGTHYEVVLGIDKNFVYLHNPARYVPRNGFHKRKHEQFMNDWWLNERNNEHWYITIIPMMNNGNFILPKSVGTDSPAFIGKYV
ncbi:MAG: hypothetical protein ACP5OA_04020 [Candidatus Woesearchaeota archaeon]